MDRVFSTAWWVTTYPVRVAWNHNRALRKAALADELNEAAQTLDDYGARVLNLVERGCALRKSLSSTDSQLPYDHQGVYYDPQARIAEICDLYGEAESAYKNMCTSVNETGPEALAALNATRLAIGHHFEPLESCLDTLLHYQSVIEVAEEQMKEQERDARLTVTKATAQSLEEVSLTRGCGKVAQGLAVGYWAYAALATLGSWITWPFSGGGVPANPSDPAPVPVPLQGNPLRRRHRSTYHAAAFDPGAPCPYPGPKPKPPPSRFPNPLVPLPPRRPPTPAPGPKHPDTPSLYPWQRPIYG